jgi:hypothetical protein
MVPHITEVMDDELKKNVFVFHAHVNQDDDRCGATDRQRTEIRGGKLAETWPSNGQTFYYRWKFRLPEGSRPRRASRTSSRSSRTPPRRS